MYIFLFVYNNNNESIMKIMPDMQISNLSECENGFTNTCSICCYFFLIYFILISFDLYYKCNKM